MLKVGTGKAVTKEKENLRGVRSDAIATRPMVPDDVNALRQYHDWEPGKKMRPFMPSFAFHSYNPGKALCAGPGSKISIGGKLDAISTKLEQRPHKIKGR